MEDAQQKSPNTSVPLGPIGRVSGASNDTRSASVTHKSSSDSRKANATVKTLSFNPNRHFSVNSILNSLNTESQQRHSGTDRLNGLLWTKQNTMGDDLVQRFQSTETVDTHPEHVMVRRWYKVATHPVFKIGVNVVILINAVQMGAAADYKGGQWDQVWNLFDHVFTAIFTVEMIVMLLALRGFYFQDAWNLLDFAIVILAIVDTWVMPLMSLHDSPIGVLRIFRMLRLLRILRMMRIFPELMTVVEGLVASMKSMIWIFLLMGITLYSAGICCVEVIGVEETLYPARDESQAAIGAEKADGFNNYLYFGTVIRSMVSLLNVVLMADWDTVIRPVFERQRYMTAFFVVIAIICSFGLLNVIIGVVVERTTQAMGEVTAAALVQRKEEQMNQAARLGEIMFEEDKNHDGRLSLDEMAHAAQHLDIVEIMENLELPHEFKFSELLLMLDSDGDGSLSKDEFVDGFMRMIYNSEFQRDCMQEVRLGRITTEVVNMNSRHITELERNIRSDINALRKEVLAALNSRSDVEMPSKSTTGPSSTASDDVMPTVLCEQPVPLKPNHVNAFGIDLAALVGQWGALTADTVGVEIPGSSRVQSTEASMYNHGQAPASVIPVWEPLQAAIIPVRLLASHPQLEAAMDCAALNSSNQSIIGFLPVIGTASNGGAGHAGAARCKSGWTGGPCSL